MYSPYRGYLYEASALAPAKSASAQADPGQAASGAQVALSIREGMYVSRGQTVFKVVNTDRVWAEFTIYPHAASYIEKGDSLVISPDFDPEWKVGAAVDFLQPFFQEGERFSKARVHLGNTKGRFLPGQLVTAHFQNRTDSVWWIPSVSVLDLGERKVVFRKENEVFSPVPVTTGRVSGTWTEVVSGLSATDTIACDGRDMSDSEGFIKTKQ